MPTAGVGVKAFLIVIHPWRLKEGDGMVGPGALGEKFHSQLSHDKWHSLAIFDTNSHSGGRTAVLVVYASFFSGKTRRSIIFINTVANVCFFVVDIVLEKEKTLLICRHV